MTDYESLFFGDLSEDGYKISYLLIKRNIKHSFIISDFSLFVIQTKNSIIEISGFKDIFYYISNYRYIYDFPEIKKWN